MQMELNYLTSLGEYVVHIKIILVALTAMAAYFSFYHECVKDGKITKHGRIAGIILVFTLSLQVANEILINLNDTEKEKSNIDRLAALANDTKVTIDKLTALADDTKITVDTISNALVGIQHLNENVAAVTQVVEVNGETMLEKDCQYIQGISKLIAPHKLVLKSLDNCEQKNGKINPPIIPLIEIKIENIRPLELFKGESELIKSIKISARGKTHTCALDQEISIANIDKLVVVNCPLFKVQKSDRVKVWLETTVQREKYFGKGMAKFGRTFIPVDVDTSKELKNKPIPLSFDYSGINTDSKYELFISTKSL